MATIDQNNLFNKTLNGTVYGDRIELTGSGTNDIVNGLNGSDNISAGDDSGNGGNYTNTVVNGGGGSDYITNFGSGCTLNGDGGQDAIFLYNESAGLKAYGGDGDDDIYVGAEANDIVLSGGSGSDSIFDYYSDTNVKMLGGSGSDNLTAEGSFERLYGQSGADFLRVDGTDSRLSGGDGSDLLEVGGYGFAGQSNILNGNAGNDQLYDYEVATQGDSVAAKLIGGQGNDQITARNNRSTMTGGQGNDLFVAEGDSLQGGAVGVTDFVHGEDHVVLSAEGASSSNYSEIKVSGGRAAAIAAAEGSSTAYTFVAGDDDGFLVYNDGSGNLTGVKIDGANQIADFDKGDIKTDAAVKPVSTQFS